ncbi:hypothetical protein VM1G_11874 [Cytospora mali]|uniref:Uncharacterized protein n=1 Tax=Cytospora mali TaxID=578113 RepID=A0A194W8Z6_CYTMA|nr:hypothetical protein VM1G_11874 [Valsa mali]
MNSEELSPTLSEERRKGREDKRQSNMFLHCRWVLGAGKAKSVRETSGWHPTSMKRRPSRARQLV